MRTRLASLRIFRLFSATEVADILAVSQSHLCAMRNMPDEGGLPVMYVGSKRTPRYAMRDVVSFIKHGGTPLKRVALKMSSTIRRRVGKSGRISYQAQVFSGKMCLLARRRSTVVKTRSLGSRKAIGIEVWR